MYVSFMRTIIQILGNHYKRFIFYKIISDVTNPYFWNQTELKATYT